MTVSETPQGLGEVEAGLGEVEAIEPEGIARVIDLAPVVLTVERESMVGLSDGVDSALRS